ncbi:MAG: methyltransferase [Bacteroidaceae bacterium]|nr:methyltransferase [Bacteroidaceae bacterium]
MKPIEITKFAMLLCRQPSLQTIRHPTMFRFQQFDVHHDRSSMRVGTDAVLLGAWAEAPRGDILDIGTGCGVIALMMAQRYPESRVVGIDVDEESVREARDNVSASPFASRVRMEVADVRAYRAEAPFACIVCNPPYFTEDTLAPDPRRGRARSASFLHFDQLVAAVAHLLAPDGLFSVVLPTREVDDFCALCTFRGLYLARRTDVRTTSRKAPKRALLTFSRQLCHAPLATALTLMDPDGSRSEAYQRLTSTFYLW